MILAKSYKRLHVRKAQKKALYSMYDYCVFDMHMPFKMSTKNLHQYKLHDENKEIGVLLSNNSLLDKSNNFVLFNKRKALAQSFQHKIIVRLIQPRELEFNYWIKMIQNYTISLSPSYIMIPINSTLDTRDISNCNLAIQEINFVLFGIAFDSDVVIYQREESIPSLSYIIHHIAFPSKTSLCINIDILETEFYSLKDLSEDILKFDIVNKISMVYTNKYSTKDRSFRDFLEILQDDVIVYGEMI